MMSGSRHLTGIPRKRLSKVSSPLLDPPQAPQQGVQAAAGQGRERHRCARRALPDDQADWGLARGTIGKGEKRIPLASITAVQWKPAGPIMSGFIQFTIPGGNEVRSRYGSQTRDAGKDENTVIFYRGSSPRSSTSGPGSRRR